MDLYSSEDCEPASILESVSEVHFEECSYLQSLLVSVLFSVPRLASLDNEICTPTRHPLRTPCTERETT